MGLEDTPFVQESDGLGAASDQTLYFSIVEGNVGNTFFRHGPVAAHLLLTAGTTPRILAAFPAGNSSVGLWFETVDKAVIFGEPKNLRALTRPDHLGRTLYGIEAEIELATSTLTVRQAVLGSARALREFQRNGCLSNGMGGEQRFLPNGVQWTRDRLDGAAGYLLAVEALPGQGLCMQNEGVSFSPDPKAGLRLRVTALSGETPLTPLTSDVLLRNPNAGNLRARQSLAFLSYEEKLLAGSWRFNTYFGRDTLMSLRLLMPALAPAAIEMALGTVLCRLSHRGEVAHEEDVGEYAIQNHRAKGGDAATPIFDYKMVDDDFMLAPVVVAYLLDAAHGTARAAHFLRNKTSDGRTYGALLKSNFDLVLNKTQAFAQQPNAAHLIHLKQGQVVGDWRDSCEGLGGGTVSYSVNVVLAPAALRAIAAFAVSAVFHPYLCAGDDWSTASIWADVWEKHAGEFFGMHLSVEAARRHVQEYAGEIGVDPVAALASLPECGLRFDAIALGPDGMPIPILHSDFGFALLFQYPSAEILEREVGAMMRPFPAGLMTGVGLVAANAAYVGQPLRPLFGPDRYHGAVIWSWQQAMLAAGLERQLKRVDLADATRVVLAEAQTALWNAILSTQAMSNSELWSWFYAEGRYGVLPFGSPCVTTDESNAAQLWSTVYLAVQAPVRLQS